MFRKLILFIAHFTRAHDIKGTLRVMKILHSPFRGVKPIETVINYDDGVVIHINTGSFMEWILFFKGYYNLGLKRLLHACIQKNQVAMDIGTNIGQYSLVMCHLVQEDGKVYMFEPQPEVRRRLEQNISLNNFKNAVVSSSAVSDYDGSAELHSFSSGEANQGNATLLPTEHPNLTQTMQVPVETIDSAVQRLALKRLDFIKIDTQGNDVAVLLGAKEALKSFRPRIAVRYDAGIYKNSGTRYSDLEDIFRSFNYRSYIVRRDKLEPIMNQDDVPSETIYAVPEEFVTNDNPRGFEV